MSKGLGKLERQVLELVKSRKSRWNAYPGQGLGVVEVAWLIRDNPPSSLYQSVCRSVRSLERKHLIKAVKRGLEYGGVKRLYSLDKE